MMRSRVRANVVRLPDRLALADAPSRAYLTDGAACRLTYAELDRAVDRVAALIRARGAGPGDIVVYQLPNIVESVILFLACARAGAIASPLLVHFDGNEIDYVVGKHQPHLFIAERFQTLALASNSASICEREIRRAHV